jgi:cytochrome c oxidase cbb3-type subunit 3
MTDRLDPGRPVTHEGMQATREIKDVQDKIAFGDGVAHLEWDGIRELDYPPPRWWVITFIGCVLFAALWMFLYPSWPTPFGTWRGVLGYDQREVVAEEVAQAEQARAPLVGAIGAAELAGIQADPSLMNYALRGGQVAFNNNCAQCHGLGGAGQGFFPSLADDNWIWGGTPGQIEYTIRHGIRNGGEEARDNIMPNFGADQILTREQIGDVTEYVLSLTGRSEDAEDAGRGAGLFAENCVACHGEGGAGLQDLGGPGLNDAIWLYGGDRNSIFNQIHRPKLGVMPAFGERLDDATIKMLVVYVHSLGGGQ